MTSARTLSLLTLATLALGATQDVGFEAALIVDATKFCSGALIHTDYVVTLARCVYKAYEVDVILGLDNLENWTETAFVSTSFVIHENYTQDQDLYDVALVKIPTLDKNLYTVSVLSLPTSQNYEGTGFVLTGYNLKIGEKKGQLGSEEAEVDAGECEDFEACERAPEKFICLVEADGQKDADYRNDGSAVVTPERDVLVGLTVQVDDTTTYTLNILPLCDWISKFV